MGSDQVSGRLLDLKKLSDVAILGFLPCFELLEPHNDFVIPHHHSPDRGSIIKYTPASKKQISHHTPAYASSMIKENTWA